MNGKINMLCFWLFLLWFGLVFQGLSQNSTKEINNFIGKLSFESTGHQESVYEIISDFIRYEVPISEIEKGINNLMNRLEIQLKLDYELEKK